MTSDHKRTIEEEAVDRRRSVGANTATADEIATALAAVQRSVPVPIVPPNPHDLSADLVCPMPSSWKRWDLLGLTCRGDIPTGTEVQIAAARRARQGTEIETLDLRWSVADDDASRKPLNTSEMGREVTHWAKDTPSHIHTEFVARGHTVHIDVVAATRYGPARSFLEARIFLDGELAGRGGSGGSSLGGGGNDFPAVALLNPRTALEVTVDHAGSSAFSFAAAALRPVVRLFRVRARRSTRRSERAP